jgi:hypothetical protein
MAPHEIQTLIEPSTVGSSLRSKIHLTLTSTITATLETLTSTPTPTPTTSPTPILATETPTTIPPLPSNFATPEPTAHQPTPAIAVLTLVFVVLFAVSLLGALLYFIVLRVRGRCTNCISLEDELHKWKTGELKPITRGMVAERMRRKWDEEHAVEGTGAMDVQATLYRERMRMQSLGMLEGLDEQGSVKGSLVESETTAVEHDEAVEYDEDAKFIASSFGSLASLPQSSLKDLRPPVEETGRKVTDDGTATSKHGSFPKTYSAYLEHVIAPREAEAARLRREGQDQLIERNLDIASDASKRESAREQAMARANEYILERVEEEKEEKETENKKVTQIARPMPAARVDRQSRFKERFSLASQRGSVSKFPGMQ